MLSNFHNRLVTLKRFDVCRKMNFISGRFLYKIFQLFFFTFVTFDPHVRMLSNFHRKLATLKRFDVCRKMYFTGWSIFVQNIFKEKNCLLL